MLNDAPDIAFESLQATGTITRVDVDPENAKLVLPSSSLLIFQPFVAFSTFFSQKLKTIWQSRGNEAVDVHLTMEEAIDWMSSSYTTVLLELMRPCRSCSLGLFSVWWSNCMLKREKNVHAPLTWTPMSLRRKVLDVGARV